MLILEFVEKIHCFILYCIRSDSGKSLQSKGEVRVYKATSYSVHYNKMIE